MTMLIVPLKIGDTLLAHGLLRDEAGDPKDLTALAISSRVKREGATEPLATLAVVKAADQVANRGEFTITGQSAEWPGVTKLADELLLWDVTITEGTTIQSTETVRLRLQEEVA